MSLEKLIEQPAASACRRLDYESAEVIETRCGRFLRVRGTAPCINMSVSLIPLIYIRCPDWWEIEVTGCLPNGICLTAIKSFDMCISLTGIIGSKGIEVVGASKSEQFDLEGGCQSREALS